ncbi:MAG: biotin carboxylase, partial [Erysipelotrichaceae bacterium]|nr:biotin carboxylase [Erysipelotrichaceae bacterium]
MENNRIEGHLVIVMAIEHYNPLSMIRSLGKNGICPVYIAIKGKGKIASSSRYISKTHYADTIEEAYELLLENYSNEELAPFILCTDDKTISYLDKHYEEIKDRFIFFNAGQEGRINEFMNKYRILKLAEKHGLPTLKT